MPPPVVPFPYFKIAAPPVWLVISTILVVGFTSVLILGWQSMTTVVDESVPALLSIMKILPLAAVTALSAIWHCMFNVPTDLPSGLRFAGAYIGMAVFPYAFWRICVAGAMMTDARQGQSQVRLRPHT